MSGRGKIVALTAGRTRCERKSKNAFALYGQWSFLSTVLYWDSGETRWHLSPVIAALLETSAWTWSLDWNVLYTPHCPRGYNISRYQALSELPNRRQSSKLANAISYRTTFKHFWPKIFYEYSSVSKVNKEKGYKLSDFKVFWHSIPRLSVQ